jgi:peptidyl-dipeptidase Dcp
MNHLLKEKFGTQLESVPFSKIKDEDFLPAIKSSIAESNQRLNAIKSNPDTPDFENTILPMEHASRITDRAASIFFNILSAESTEKMQKAAKTISPMLSDFYNSILLDTDLFSRIKTIWESDHGLKGEDFRLLEHTYEAMKRQGAGLNTSSRDKLKKMSRKIASHSLDFDNNCLQATNAFELHITDQASLSGLPDHTIEAGRDAAKERDKDGWIFTLQYPSYLPFMKYADDRSLREKMYMARMTQCGQKSKFSNQKHIKEIVGLRIKTAHLLGYETYADYILEKRMAESRTKVISFLNRLAEASVPKAKKELSELQEYAQSLGYTHSIMPWDRAYFAEKLKKARLNINDTITRPYFSLEQAEKSAFELAGRLYGLSFTERSDIDVYNEEVKVFEVTGSEGEFTGLLYMDFFPRKSKQSGAWMTNYKEQMIQDGKNIRPHVSLVFNFTRPGQNQPALLSFSEFTTLLHEFGHGLHALLSQCTYESLSGTSVSRDFVELPSQFMENFAYEKSWLKDIARHYETGEPMPDDMIEKLSMERQFQAGYSSARQVGLALTDMAWHSLEKMPRINITEFESEAMKDVSVLPKVKGCATSPSFGHIFAGGYAAGYYGYKWAEVLDADAFEVFRDNGLFDKATADKFRTEILERGNSRKEMDSYVAFRGREPKEDALLKRNGLKN